MVVDTIKIILDGIIEECKFQVEDCVKQVFNIAFPEGNDTVDEICFPANLLEKINQEYRKEFPDYTYELPKYGDLAGKTFNVDGRTKIILNNKYYENGIIQKEVNQECFNIQISTIFHELMHAKYYIEIFKLLHDYKNYNYPVDKLLFHQAENLYDEYYAVNNTVRFFLGEGDIGIINEFINLLENEYKNKQIEIIECVANSDWKNVQKTAICYVDEVKRYLSMSLGIIDVINNIETVEEYIKNINDRIHKTFIGDIFNKIHLLLKKVNGIPSESDIIIMSGYLHEIYQKFGVEWEEVPGKGDYVRLVKDISNFYLE